MGATVDLGGAPMATRMLGGFILVAFFLSLLLAWPGRRRWPIWLISGLCLSLTGSLVMSLLPSTAAWFSSMRTALVALAIGFVAAAALTDLRDPVR